VAGPRSETLPIRSEQDVVRVRQRVREAALEVRFNLVEQTKLVTAASELARNTLVHGGGGEMRLELLNGDGPRGIRLTFSDEGPGIPDIALALKEGYTTGSGLGLGLSGSKKLVSEFEIDSAVGRGTRVTVTRWK
jgi:serine/threonine-protein kinase RsbT